MSFKVLSIENFPSVEIHQFPSTVEEITLWLNELDQLFIEGKPFVLVYPVFDPVKFMAIDEKVSQESRKKVILWLKSQRALFEEKCKGIVLQLKPDGSDIEMIEGQRKQVETVYRVPAKVLYPEHDQSVLVNELLSQ